MTRFAPFAALLAATVAPTAASAATYSAKPVAPATAKHILSRDIAWTCAATACRGSTENSRPLLLCQGLAKQAGRLESFAVDGRALPLAELDKCNSAARDSAPVLARAN